MDFCPLDTRWHVFFEGYSWNMRVSWALTVKRWPTRQLDANNRHGFSFLTLCKVDVWVSSRCALSHFGLFLSLCWLGWRSGGVGRERVSPIGSCCFFLKARTHAFLLVPYWPRRVFVTIRFSYAGDSPFDSLPPFLLNHLDPPTHPPPPLPLLVQLLEVITLHWPPLARSLSNGT